MFRAAVLGLFVAAILPGCTLVGGAIGSAMPEYTAATVDGVRDGTVDPGEKIAVVRDSDGTEFVGKFRGVDSRGIEVETADELVTIDTADVRGVSVARDSRWLEGTLVGLAVDVAVVVFVGTRIARSYPDTSSFGNVHIGSDGVTVGGR